MKGMGQIVSWSVRDESLHCEGIIKLFHTYAKEIGGVPKAVADDIVASCHKVIEMDNCPMETFEPKLADGDFRVLGHKLEMYGYCRDCDRIEGDKR